MWCSKSFRERLFSKEQKVREKKNNLRVILNPTEEGNHLFLMANNEEESDEESLESKDKKNDNGQWMLQAYEYKDDINFLFTCID